MSIESRHHGHNGRGKVAIVTGASRGIGRAIALQLARDGYAVTVNYVGRRECAEKVVNEIEQAGGRAIAVKADVSRTEDVVSLFDQTEQAFGPITALVNNAGIMIIKPIAELSDEEFDRMFAINTRGVFMAMREASRRLQDGGKIVNLSTSATPLRMPGFGAYCGTKSAVDALTAVFAKELRGRNITVNAVAPGPVATELFFHGKSPEQVERMAMLNPFERIADPEDISRLVSLLLSPDSTWVNGQTILANGGMV